MKRRDDPNQTLFNWANLVAAPVAAAAPSIPDPVKLVADVPPLIQHLPWDFKTTFPKPRDDAIDSGILDESDREPENLRELHECHARQCLAALKSLDVVTDARRRGIDPATGKPPRTHAAKERLRKYLQDEPAKLEHAFRVMIETYESAFGDEAAAAFEKAIRAWHAGIPVETERPSPRQDDMVDSSKMVRSRPSRASSALPVPRPLRSSVTAGVFGQEENGKPVNPGADEVRAIIEQHADKMIELAEKELPAAVAKCAEDFGPKAAAQLERYVRRQREDRSR